MQRFFVMRHAKSSWQHPVDDHERPLNDRGKNDTVTMGHRLAAQSPGPAFIITSTAQRAVLTANGVAACLGLADDKIIYDERLYLAGPGEILDVVHAHRDLGPVMAVAHNPGLTELVNRLADDRLDNLPTAGIARFDYRNKVNSLDVERPEQVWIDYPKNPDGLLRLS